MNYIQEAERIMKDYRKLIDSVKNMKKRKNILSMRGVPSENTQANYSKEKTSGNKYANDTINELCEISQLNIQIKETEAEIQFISEILKQIKLENETLEKFLKLRYIEMPQVQLKKIAAEIGYSEDSNHTIYEIKNKALREFAIRYFGVHALKYT